MGSRVSSLFGLVSLMAGMAMAGEPEDPLLWLEDVTGDRALSWVRERNAESTAELAESPEFRTLERRILSILDSDAKIPMISRMGPYYYNFWKDAKHKRGLWRRTTLDEYRKDEPAWETVIDLDALGEAEKENWVWHGATPLKPAYERCLVSLSRGGADADVCASSTSRPRPSSRADTRCPRPRARSPGGTSTASSWAPTSGPVRSPNRAIPGSSRSGRGAPRWRRPRPSTSARPTTWSSGPIAT